MTKKGAGPFREVFKQPEPEAPSSEQPSYRTSQHQHPDQDRA